MANGFACRALSVPFLLTFDGSTVAAGVCTRVGVEIPCEAAPDDGVPEAAPALGLLEPLQLSNVAPNAPSPAALTPASARRRVIRCPRVSLTIAPSVRAATAVAGVQARTRSPNYIRLSLARKRGPIAIN